MGFFDSFGQSSGKKAVSFDINILPLNLSDGRNIGELSGLYLYTAPKKAENSRLSDIFIVLIHVDNSEFPEKQMKEWGDILSAAYFAARGSLTMGVSAAVKAFADSLAKSKKIKILPVIFLNIAVIRERTLLAAHAGPVNTTVISSDNVQNFCDEASLPIQLKSNALSFFTTDIHSENIILMCPYVPNDWTNTSIMEVASDSPLNAIRFLLDRSGGNLKAAVIQLKTGNGQILYRTRTTITANVKPEFEEKLEPAFTPGRRSSDVLSRYRPGESAPGPEKPLFRQKKALELFEDPKPEEQKPENTPESSAEEEPEEGDRTDTLTGEKELPGSARLDVRFKELPTIPVTASSVTVPVEKPAEKEAEVPPVKITSEKKKKKKQKRNLGRLLLILFCGILIPIIVVFTLFLVYSGRSKDQIQREYLNRAVQYARAALAETDPKKQESLWTDVLEHASQAASYGGNSASAKTLMQQSLLKLDQINGGISTVYNFANSSMLPQGLNITEISASGQYTYALDSSSGSVMRFVASGSGLALDNAFSCTPGVYRELGKDGSSLQVGKLVDFTILPAGSPHNFVLAGVDSAANVLYCSAYAGNQAGKLIRPELEKLSVDSITMYGNAMYLLDTEASAVYEYVYSKADGFNFEPSNFYGSYSPYLTDAIDFALYKDYAYFLRSNGTLMICDYTGYKPDCRNITELESEDHSAYIDLSLHRFKKIMVNSSPDNSVYLTDARLQSLLNISVKGNYIRYITPNRTSEELLHTSEATGFGITGQNRLLWSYRNDLYIGYMP